MIRIFGIDLIRSLAVFLVLSVHFFLNTGFYDQIITDQTMIFPIMLRWFFYLGVPLFLLITGYLKKDKKLDKKYYSGLKKVLISYFFISILCILLKKYYLHDSERMLVYFVSLFDFTADGYAWYIEMYIGLFLLIPFLNVLYNNLESKQNKQILILTLMFLVSLNPLINYFKIDGIKMDVVPNWWTQIYPLLYYFIGCYIKEYQVKINKIKSIIIILAIIIIESFLSYMYNYNNLFSWDFIGGYGSLQTVIASTLLFCLLYNVNCQNKVLSNIFYSIANISLDIYLFSFIVDSIVYLKFINVIDSPLSYFKYYPIIICIVFICSFLLAYIKKVLFDLIGGFYEKIYLVNR